MPQIDISFLEERIKKEELDGKEHFGNVIRHANDGNCYRAESSVKLAEYSKVRINLLYELKSYLEKK